MNNLLLKISLGVPASIMLAALTWSSAGGPVLASEARTATTAHGPAASSPTSGPTDPAELESFLDALFKSEMDEFHIAGAAVAVVKDGRLFFTKGYGYADVDKDLPIVPDQTLFYIGSITKLFTWTAVMQLVEQGKLDLNADINTYLDFRIPDTFPEPITLRHLMTHTSGFEDRLLGSVVTDANDRVPAREWLVSNLSARVHPPGEFVGYANINAILAGYIVSRVSGQTYDDYIQEHIFDPLGMKHSTARSPSPPDLRALTSVGYRYRDGAYQPVPTYIGQPAGLPSGSIQTTAADMARFMIAHLADGRYSDANISGVRILEEDTARQMHSTQYTPDPRLLGMAFGFAEVSDNGQRALGHQGYFPPMHSELFLLPEQNLGVFVTYNSADADYLSTQHVGFHRAFVDHYYPVPKLAPRQPPAGFAERAGRFVGEYELSSSPHTTLIKIIELFGAYRAEITSPGDGTLLARVQGLDLRFVEVEPLLFRQVDGPFAMLFGEGQDGRITDMYTDFMPQYAAVKLDWYETRGFNMALALGCVLVFLSMILVAALRWLRNRGRQVEQQTTARGIRVAYRILLGVCVLNLLFVVGTMLWGNPPTELGSLTPIAKVVLGLGVGSAALTVGALVCALLAWKNGYWGFAFRSYYTLVTVAALAFVWFLNYWNLLGWRY